MGRRLWGTCHLYFQSLKCSTEKSVDCQRTTSIMSQKIHHLIPTAMITSNRTSDQHRLNAWGKLLLKSSSLWQRKQAVLGRIIHLVSFGAPRITHKTTRTTLLLESRCLVTIPLPSNDRRIHTQTHRITILRIPGIRGNKEADRQTDTEIETDLIRLIFFFKISKLKIVYETGWGKKGLDSSDVSVSLITKSYLVYILEATRLCGTRAPATSDCECYFLAHTEQHFRITFEFLTWCSVCIHKEAHKSAYASAFSRLIELRARLPSHRLRTPNSKFSNVSLYFH